MDESAQMAIAGVIVGAGTALAGLILVFLGGIFTSYESYDADQQTAVRSKYILRASLALAGFITALLAAGFGLAAHWLCPCSLVYGGAILLSVAFVLILVVAIMAVRDLF